MSDVCDRLQPGDVARAAIAVPVLLALDLSVRFFGVRRTHQLMQRVLPGRTGKSESDPVTAADIERVALALDRAGSRVCRWPGRCLRRSLALWGWLRLRNVDAELHLGVRRDPAGITGHAWVSRDGQPIAESPDMLASHVSFGAMRLPRRH